MIGHFVANLRNQYTVQSILRIVSNQSILQMFRPDFYAMRPKQFETAVTKKSIFHRPWSFGLMIANSMETFFSKQHQVVKVMNPYNLTIWELLLQMIKFFL